MWCCRVQRIGGVQGGMGGGVGVRRGVVFWAAEEDNIVVLESGWGGAGNGMKVEDGWVE